MDLPEEIHTWTNEQIEAAVRSACPEGLEFDFSLEEGTWVVCFLSEDEQVVWESSNLDPRLALYDAYGYLWAINQPQAKAQGVWVPKPQRPKAAVSPKVRVADPEDLDPEEIASVYGKTKL